MRIILDSTTEIGTIELQGVPVPARLWIGRTQGGEPVAAFIVRVAPLTGDPSDELWSELQKAPHGDVLAIVDRAELPATMDDFGGLATPEDRES